MTMTPIQFLICSFTLFFSYIMIGPIKKKIIIPKKLFKKINTSFWEMIKQNVLLGFLLIIGILLIIFLFCLIPYKYCFIDNRKEISIQNILLLLVIWAITVLIIYFVLGSLFAFVNYVTSVLEDAKKGNVGTKMLNSFTFLTILTLLLVIYEKDIHNELISLSVIFIVLSVCYITNLQAMYIIVKNPFSLTKEPKIQGSKNRNLFIFCSVFIIGIVILNLYLFVLCTHLSFQDAYACNKETTINDFSLLYYTFISFTTIGYGDIFPTIIPSQAVAVLISITSVICLIVFISSVLSAKKPSSDDTNEGEYVTISTNEADGTFTKRIKEEKGDLTSMSKLMDDIIRKVNIKRIKKMIKKGYTKEDILKLDYSENAYYKAIRELIKKNITYKEYPAGIFNAYDSINGKEIGAISICGNGKCYFIHSFHVHPKYRNNHIGLNLMKLAAYSVKSKGANFLYVTPIADTAYDDKMTLKELHEIYEKIGFKYCNEISNIDINASGCEMYLDVYDFLNYNE